MMPGVCFQAVELGSWQLLSTPCSADSQPDLCFHVHPAEGQKLSLDDKGSIVPGNSAVPNSFVKIMWVW